MSDIISKEFGEATQTSAVTATGAPAATPEPAAPAPKEPAAPVAFASDPSVGLYNDEPQAPPTAGWAKGTELPLIYHAAAQARAAGYSWDEINDRFATARQAANDAGYTDSEVNKAFGLAPSADKEPTPPGLEDLNLQPDTADNIRAFANKYFTPDNGEDFQPPKSAGDFARMIGWDVVDIGKIIGGGVVNGMAAIVEGLDGRPRSHADQIRLGIEAQGFLGVLGSPDMAGWKGATPKGATPPTPIETLRQTVPTVQETLDAATAVAKAHPEGLTKDTLLHASQSLGQNFTETGEHPLDAAQRAVNDPAVMTTIHAHMDANRAAMAESRGAPPEALLPDNEPLDAKGVEAEGAAAVQHPGLIPDTGEPIAAQGSFANAKQFGVSSPRPPAIPSPLINPETIGQVNPQLSGGLLNSFRQTFAIQGLDQAGAGMLRHAFAQTQAILIRSSENLRRFGRAVGDLSSAARRDWWHAYEGGEATPFQAQDLPGRAQEMFDRAGLPDNIKLRVVPGIQSSTPGTITHGYYDAFSGEIVIAAHANEATVAHEIAHALYDRTNEMLTHEQRTIMDARANRWLNKQAEGGGTNRAMLKKLGYPDSQLTEEGMARLIGENPRVTNARDALAQYKDTSLGEMGAEIRKELDRRYAKMLKLGIAPDYVDGYLPRMYQDPSAAAKIFGKRPLGGTGTHMRQRVFEFLADAEAAGLKLVTDNPVEAVLMRLHDMDKFIMKHEIASEMHTNGMGGFYKAGERIPEGLTQVPGITLPGESGTFYAHTPTAIMINRYLSPGVGGTVFKPIYDVIRGSTAMYTSIKLTMSMYHPVVLTANSIFSAAATGLVQMSRGGFGNVVAGLGRVAKSPLAPIEDYILGRKLINYAKTGEGGDFKLTNMYRSLIAGGTRFGASEVAHSSAAGSFWRNIHGSLVPASGLATVPQEVAAMFRNAPPISIGGIQIAPGYVRAMGQMVPRVIDTLSGPIMDGFVPAMKAGASARMLQEALDAHPDMGLADIRRVAGRISDITDNRIGETVQDNLFWNKWIHDINNVLFMAPQWFMGKLRLISGAAADGLNKGVVEGALSHNIAYMIAVPAGLMMMGALYGAAKGTWNADWTLHDYFHPPTGGTDAQGNPERIDIPTPAKDAYGWTHHPEQELMNKVNGAYGMVQDLATNRQYGGKVAITDPSAPLSENVSDYAHELAKQLAPIIYQKPGGSESNISLVEQLLGIRPSTYEIENPEKAASFNAKDTRRAVKAKNKQDAQ